MAERLAQGVNGGSSMQGRRPVFSMLLSCAGNWHTSSSESAIHAVWCRTRYRLVGCDARGEWCAFAVEG